MTKAEIVIRFGEITYDDRAGLLTRFVKYLEEFPDADVIISDCVIRPKDSEQTKNTRFPRMKLWPQPKIAVESLESQVDRLGRFILSEVPGEPSQDDGAIDTAIRTIRKLLKGGKE